MSTKWHLDSLNFKGLKKLQLRESFANLLGWSRWMEDEKESTKIKIIESSFYVLSKHCFANWGII